MQKVKRIRLIAICLVFAMSFTACANKSTQEPEAIQQEVNDEVIFLRLWGAEREQEFLQQLVESFKEKYSEEATFDITIELVDEGECKERILENVNGAPDVFTFADDQFMELLTAGVLEPITHQEEVESNNIEGAVEASKFDDQIYAYPITADNGYFMYYNKKYFTDEDVKTLDRMLEIAQKENKKIAMDWESGWYIYSFFGNTGLTLGLNDDYITNYCTWNSTKSEVKGIDVAKAMRRIASYKSFQSTNDTAIVEGIQDGSIIAGVSGTWNSVMIEEALQENYGAVKLPTYTLAGNQVQMASYAGYKMLGVNSYSENVEWAEKLAMYLSSEEVQLQRFQNSGQCPSNIHTFNSEEVSNSVAISALIQQSEFANLQRVGVHYWDASSKFGKAMVTGELGGKSLQILLNDTVKAITSSIIEE